MVSMTKRRTCARPPWRIVEIQSCVLPNVLAYCIINYLITESEVVTGKSQTVALLD